MFKEDLTDNLPNRETIGKVHILLVEFWELWPQDTPISLTASDTPGPFPTIGCINCPY